MLYYNIQYTFPTALSGTAFSGHVFAPLKKPVSVRFKKQKGRIRINLIN